MPGDLEDALAHDVRRIHDVVAVPEDEVLLELLDLAPDDGALGVPQDQAGTDAWVGREEVELTPQHAVVPLLGLLETLQVLGEMSLLEEGGPVDALEHLALLVASPVRSRSRKELEVLEAAGRRDVRAPAQVEERSVLIDRDDLVLREFLETLQFQGIVGEELAGLFHAHDTPLEAVIRLRDLGHLDLESF